METTNKKLPLAPMILCVTAAVTARVIGLVYSFFATDVVYWDSAVIYILPVLKQIFSDLVFALAAAGVVIAMRDGVSVKKPVAVYFAVLIVDYAVFIVYDTVTGALPDVYWILLGIGQRLLALLSAAVFMIAAYFLTRAMMKRGIPAVKCAAIAAVIPPAVDLLSVLIETFVTLVEVDFLPYADEIFSMGLDVGTVLVSAAVSAAAAAVTVRGCSEK